MKPGRGKQKGSSFERDICSRLSRWLTDGSRNDVLWRSAMSGGRSVEAACGDISAVAEEGFPFTNKFVIECKHYNEQIFAPLVFHQYSQLNKWWPKLLNESLKFKRHPMLIVKQQNKPTLVVVSGATSRRVGIRWSTLWVDSQYLVFFALLDNLLASGDFKSYVRRPGNGEAIGRVRPPLVQQTQ